MKKTIFLTVFLILILITNISFASYSTVTMSVVEEPVCTINIGENSKFEKKLIAKDLNNKEVTLQLQVTNEEISNKPTGEIVLVIDNSNSMNQSTSSGELRGNIIRNSAKSLITELLKDNSNLKVGAVSFSTTTEKNSDGYYVLGTENDSTLLSNLSSDISVLTNAIDNIYYAPETVASYTNLQAGLNRAKKIFSNEQNKKYIIVLTDGIPNVVLGRNEVKYDNTTISNTKTEYESLVSSNISIITMLTGISETQANIPVSENGLTYNEYIQNIFGTTQDPNFGKFYYINDEQIENTVTNDIYNSLVSTDKTFKNLKIIDYFPKEIIDNFDFAYVSQANIGNISAEIDKSNNSITWTIPELAVGQTATVQYKLKLKENFSSEIVGKILNTNEKVDITYTDYNNSTETKTSDITPKLKLVEPPPVLPKTGLTTLIFVGSILLIIFVLSAGKLILINKKIK